MSDLSSRIDTANNGALQRAQLLEFVAGFKAECGARITFLGVELRRDASTDDTIIFIQYMIDDAKHAIHAEPYALPDPIKDYEDYGRYVGKNLQGHVTILHVQV